MLFKFLGEWTSRKLFFPDDRTSDRQTVATSMQNPPAAMVTPINHLELGDAGGVRMQLRLNSGESSYGESSYGESSSTAASPA